MLHVEFFVDAVEDRGASKKAGRSIFKEVEFVRIRFPGDNKRAPQFRAHERAGMNAETGMEETWAERYPKHYAAFKEDAEYIGDGAPIGSLPGLSVAKVKEFKAVNIHTVQALAGLPDAQIRKLGMGTRDMVEKAKAWLGGSEADTVAAQSAEIADLKAQVAALQAASEPQETIADLKAALKEKTGARVLGNPSIETLRERLAETEAQ